MASALGSGSKSAQRGFPIAAKVSAGFLLALVLAATLADVIAPGGATQDIVRRLQPPVWAGGTFEHVLGTDQLGRDVLVMIMFGARISLLVGVSAVLVAGVTGVVLGLIAGFFGGRVDSLIMRFADLQLAFPIILVVIVARGLIGGSLTALVLIMGFAGWVIYGRTARAATLAIRAREFVEAAQALGARPRRILTFHVLPNILGPLAVIAALQVGTMILLEASLSFLGLGVSMDTRSWGSMIAEGRDYLARGWWISTFPGLALFFTILAVNYLGDALRGRFGARRIT